VVLLSFLVGQEKMHGVSLCNENQYYTRLLVQLCRGQLVGVDELFGNRLFNTKILKMALDWHIDSPADNMEPVKLDLRSAT